MMMWMNGAVLSDLINLQQRFSDCFLLRMAMITQKHRAFVSEPMLEKPVTAVPGIRPTLGRELQKEGITKVHKTRKADVRQTLLAGGFL